MNVSISFVLGIGLYIEQIESADPDDVGGAILISIPFCNILIYFD